MWVRPTGFPTAPTGYLPAAQVCRRQGSGVEEVAVTRNAARRGAPSIVVALVAITVIAPSGARAAPKTSFVNIEVAGTPPNPNPPPGVACPQSTPSTTCTNFAAEPAIDVADDGTFF